MKVQLRDHVHIRGETSSTRNVEVYVNWDRRIVVLADGRWVPFEGVSIGDPVPPAFTEAELRSEEATGPILDHLASKGWGKYECHGCGRADFATAAARNGHKRHCK